MKGELKQTIDSFEIIDALGGEVTGDYRTQLKELEENGITCSESVYYEAYQMSVQL